MKILHYTFLCSLILNSVLIYSKTYYVTPAGQSLNDGSSFENPLDFSTALNIVEAGDSILLQSGTYIIPYIQDTKNTIYFTKSGTEDNNIYIIAYDNSRVVFDFSFPEKAWVQDSYGFDISGSYWYFKGVFITRAGYQGAYVKGTYNTFENCAFYNNRNTGLEINKGGAFTTVINCDAYRNYDPKKNGSMADGFGPKQTQGSGNQFINCRAWENSDDGYDCFDSPEIVSFENCQAFRNGVDVWHYEGFAGNGNGFKVGGNYQEANHLLIKCLAYEHPNKGFDQNNNTGGLTIYNCTSYKNGINFGLGNNLNSGQNHILKNNISLSGSNSISNAIEEYNSWNESFLVSEDDFKSLDLSNDTISRNPDGSIPQTDLFQLKSTSLLIDAGTDVGLPFNGNAPDLGCYESEYTLNPVLDNYFLTNENSIYNYPNPFYYTTCFVFNLEKPANIKISIYNIDGKIAEIVNNQIFPKGMNTVEYNGMNLEEGIYLYRIEMDEQIITNKLVKIK